MHVDVGQQVHHVGALCQRNPVELHVLARGEVGVAAVVLAGDARELADLRRRQFTVGHGHAQHRRMALDVPAVLQAQRTELVIAQLAGQIALKLVAELCSALTHKLLVEFGVLVHGVCQIKKGQITKACGLSKAPGTNCRY